MGVLAGIKKALEYEGDWTRLEDDMLECGLRDQFDGEQTGLEGCLSVPGKYGVVTRPYTVRVRAQDRDGAFFEVEDEALTARCFCHEIEHLDGHLFVEHTDQLLTEEELEEYIRRQEEGDDEE